MATTPSPAGTMKLVGGELCLDFVNTVGGRVAGEGGTRSTVVADKLAAYADLVAWSRHAGTIGDPDARRLARLAASRPREADEVLERALALREALHRALCAIRLGRRPDAADVARLNAEISDARAHEFLAPAPEGLRWEWPGAGSRLHGPLWPIARSAAALLVSGDLSRLRECGGERCGWLFLDRSRNGTRQWCTMEDCGNVSKVRRFRERHQDRTGRERRSSRPSRST